MGDLKDLINYKVRNNVVLDYYLSKIDEYYNMSPKELREAQNNIFIKLVHHSYKQSSFYRGLYDKYDIDISKIKSIEDIDSLPIIDKSLIRNKVNNIITVNKAFLVKGYTSGTNGSPLTVYRSVRAIILENAYVWQFRNRHGLKIGEPCVSLRGVLDKNTFEKYDKYSNTLYLSSYNINPKNIKHYLDRIKEFKPKAVLGYPSSIYALSLGLEECKMKVEIPFVFTSSETLYEFQRDKINKIFNANIFDWYGNAERTIALGQCDCGLYHEPPLYSINEYKENSIITTSLINFSFPLIRYKVNDSVELADNTIERCQSKYICINKVNGRSDDFIILKDKTLIGRLDVAFKGVQNILYSQIIQNDFDVIEVKLVVTKEFSRQDSDLLYRNLTDRIGNEVSIRINLINEAELIKSISGKYKLVINRIINDSSHQNL